jgi:hypothetical protein
MKTTISGQLVLSMLCEKLADIPDSLMILTNTDGAEILIPRIYENLYYDICKQWENETKLILEFVDYKKMWIRDINNYGAMDINGKIKNKGCFEVNKMIGSEPAYHKDNSFKIVPIALQEFFVNNIDVETTIKNHKNIYDFCGRVKSKHDSWYEMSNVKQQKNVRYYVSKDGGKLLKKYKDGRTSEVHVDYRSTVANKIYDDKSYDDINYIFYVKECYKIIDTILPKQLNLF